MAAHTLKSQLFNTWTPAGGVGTWTVPANVSLVFVTAIAGGGGGGGCNPIGTIGAGAGGGGCGEFCFRRPLKVTPGGTVSFSIGRGGAGGSQSAVGRTGLIYEGLDGVETIIQTATQRIRLDPGKGGPPQYAAGGSGSGGGTHPYEGISGNGLDGPPGKYEGAWTTAGGAGGGRRSATGTKAPDGAPCHGNIGGIGGERSTAPVTNLCPKNAGIQGGGGGAASPWGIGGYGGTFNGGACGGLCNPAVGCSSWPQA